MSAVLPSSPDDAAIPAASPAQGPQGSAFPTPPAGDAANAVPVAASVEPGAFASLDAPASASASSPVPAAYAEAVAGLTAYVLSLETIRYAKDGAGAQSMSQRWQFLDFSAGRVAAMHHFQEACEKAGLDATALSAPYMASLKDFDERLRPVTWPERLLKTYVSFGLLTDFCLILASVLDAEQQAQHQRALGEDPFPSIAEAELIEIVQADAQVAARLGLWGRRVVGEEVGALLRLLAQYPGLLAGPLTGSDVHERLSDGVLQRMRTLGLSV